MDNLKSAMVLSFCISLNLGFAQPVFANDCHAVCVPAAGQVKIGVWVTEPGQPAEQLQDKVYYRKTGRAFQVNGQSYDELKFKCGEGLLVSSVTSITVTSDMATPRLTQ